MSGQQQYGQQPQYQGYPTYDVPQPTIELHPPEATIGMVTEFEDVGITDGGGRYEPKHQFKFRIDCFSKALPRRDVDGRRHFVYWWVNFAGGREANLTFIREAALGRELKSEEMNKFNPFDVVGKFLRYEVYHKKSESTGRVNARIKNVGKLSLEDRQKYDSAPYPFEVLVNDDHPRGHVYVQLKNAPAEVGHQVYLEAQTAGAQQAQPAAPQPAPAVQESEPPPEAEIHPDSTGDDDLPF